MHASSVLHASHISPSLSLPLSLSLSLVDPTVVVVVSVSESVALVVSVAEDVVTLGDGQPRSNIRQGLRATEARR